MWLTAIQAVLKLLGFAELAEKLIQSRNDRVAGMNQQQLKELEATKNEDATAASIHDSVGRMSNTELDDELRGNSAARRPF